MKVLVIAMVRSSGTSLQLKGVKEATTSIRKNI